MKRRKEIKLNKIIIIFVLLLIIFLLIPEQTSFENYEEMHVKEVKYTEGGALVILSNNYHEFSFYTTKEQGESIEFGLYNKSTKRPLTHDIFVSSLRKFGISVSNLKITKLIEGTYYAELTLKQFLFSKKIDIRPSDGVAIAIRTNAKIYVNKDLVSETNQETSVMPQTLLY